MQTLLTTREKSQLLERWHRERGLSGNALKAIACFFMFFDHLAQGVALNSKGLVVGDLFNLAASLTPSTIAGMMTLFGRIAFPIFCFLAVQGILLTRDYKKQIVRLFIFALISEVPFDLGLFGTPFYWDHQNVMFTLGLGAATIALMAKAQATLKNETAQRFVPALIFIVTAVISEFLKLDYGASGIIAMVLFYLAIGSRKKTMLAGLIGFLFEAPLYGMVYLSLPLIYWYNGERGRGNRYAFYLFYPGHLLLLYVVSRFI